jgi:hypothetical protein
MQLSSGINGAIGTGNSVQGGQHWEPAAAGLQPQQAMQLLGGELAALRRSRFRCCW